MSMRLVHKAGLVWLLAGLMIGAFSARAQTVCEFGQQACGKTCYDPAKGQSCTNGVVCGFGLKACGNTCYDPAKGQSCTSGVVCGFGLKACGTTCYDPAKGQSCHQ